MTVSGFVLTFSDGVWEYFGAMYGKHFAAMYEGSMVGAGAVVFAVMGYVIANAVPDRKVGMQVELNPKLLAFILGEKQDEIEKAIRFLCAPDKESRTKAEEGRRLVRIGQFSYRVVNGAKYRAMRDEEKRREQNREAKRRERSKKNGDPLPGESDYEQAIRNGATEAQLDSIVERHLPKTEES